MVEGFYFKKKMEDCIEQADIFTSLPFFNINSISIKTIDAVENEVVAKIIDLGDYKPAENEVLKNAVVDVELRPGMVITQNCDVLRSEYVSFCEIKKLVDVDRSFQELTTDVKKLKFLTKDYAHKEKYFYLPDEAGVFDEKMAVDFSRIYQIERNVLQNMLNKRIGALGKVPLDHFRVKISNYFKRFAYDKWYLLKKSEFISYYDSMKEKEDKCELDLIKPFPWQE